MTRKSALELAFAPDDYLVTWHLPSSKGDTINAPGALTLEADKPPRGVAYGDLSGQLREFAPGAYSFPQYVEVPAMTGKLSNGANVILVDAQLSYGFSAERAAVSAAAAIITRVNVHPSNSFFRSFKIQITGLDAIAGVGPIERTYFPKEGAEKRWTAELSNDYTQEWECGGVSFALTYAGSFRTFDPYAFSVGFAPVLSCELTTPIPLRQLLDEWINPLRRIVSIATGRPEQITYLAVAPSGQNEVHQLAQVFGSGITQGPYESSREEIVKIDSPLRLKPDDVSLLGLVRRWQQLTESHHPLLETYGAMLHARDQHPRSRFLLLLQSIEGAHGYATKESFARRQEEHIVERNEIVNLVSEYLAPRQLKFLKSNLLKRPAGGLEIAINWLVKDLPGELKSDLEGTSLIVAARAEPGNAKNAPDALRIIRNNLSHGTKGYDASDLHQVVEILEQMVRAYALQLLGCPKVVVQRVFGAS